MARIRTVKPEFFRHEKLQTLGPLAMLIFEGLWTQCDKAGRFQWKPRTLKLDILPFIDFDMEKELNKLSEAFFIIKYEVQGEFFGVIPTFGEHQRVSGKEAQEPPKYPDPPAGKPKKTRKLPREEKGSDWEASGKQSGSNGDGQESQEGKGKEEEREGNGSAALPHHVLDYLNQKSGKRFRATEAHLKIIGARVAEGYTEADFRKVIDIKTADWLHDPKMEVFLRPSTLFQASKFDGYLNQINSGVSHGQNGSRGGNRRESRAEQLDRDAAEFLGELRGTPGRNPQADYPDVSVRGASQAGG